MIRAFSPLLLGTLLLPGLVQGPGKLRPVSGQVATDGIDDLISQLASPEFSERKAAAAKLEKLGDKALPKLSAIVKSSNDPDLRFQARRLIRRIQGRSKGLGRVEPKLDRGSRQDRDFGDIQDELEHRLDEVRKRLDEIGIGVGLRPFDFDHMFRDLPKGAKGKSQSSSQSTKVTATPDGVEVEINDNGNIKRYTAPDMKTLLETHPELRGRVGGSSIHIGKPGKIPGTMNEQFERMRREMERMRKSFGRDFDDFDWSWPRIDKKPDKTKPGPLRRIEPKTNDQGPKLGVMIRPASPDVVSFLGLPSGVGLMVDQVVEGSKAEKIGLKPDDLVVKVNGKWIRSPADVADALRSAKGGTTVEYYRKGQKRSGGSK